MALYSVTERETFQRCERQWRLSSKNGWHLGEIVSPIYLNVGTLIHEGFKSWILDTNGGSFEGHVMVAASAMLDHAQARYLAQVGKEMSDDEEAELNNSIYFARTMSRNYETRWGTPIPVGFRMIAPEQRAQVPVPGTEHPCEQCEGAIRACSRCLGDPYFVEMHFLDMRFDGLIADSQNRIHVLEHKTYNAKPQEDSLKYSDQFLAYIWGARQLGLGPVVGLAYDGLWRRDKIPKGRSFEDLFFRYEHVRSNAEFEEFAELLPFELNDMWSKREAVRPIGTLPINRRWLGCFDCAFNDNKKTGKLGLCGALSRKEVALQDILLKTRYTTRDDDLEGDDAESDAA